MPGSMRSSINRSKSFSPSSISRKALEFRNTNLLVANPAWQVDVQKTGYIQEAGRCLVMQAVIDGRPVVMVLLNSFGKLTPYGDSNRLRKWLLASG